MGKQVFIQTTHISTFQKLGFDLEAEENKGVKEFLKLTPDGKILSVDSDKVRGWVKDSNVNAYRMGRKSLPKFTLKNEDDFWNCVAHLVDLDEDV